MNAAEFRYLVFSFCRSKGTQPSLRVLAGELGEMPIKESLPDPQFNGWILQVRLNLFDDAP